MLRVAVIGAGHWGPNLVRTFHSGVSSTVTWVAESRAERVAQLAPRFPGVRFTADADAVLADPAVDAVVIATPTSTHGALCRRALEAGKHVLVEKPLTTDAREALELDALATRLGRVLLVGHVFLFNPAVRHVKRVLDEGGLGRVLTISMVRTNLGPIRTDVDAAWDLASHDVAIADFWLGAGAVAVSARGGAWVNPGVNDSVFATLRYELPHGEVLVSLHCSWLHPRKVRDVAVVGERRMLTFDDLDLVEPVRVYDKGVAAAEPASFAAFRSAVRQGDVTIPRVAMEEPLALEAAHFVECIETGARPLADATRAAGVVRTLEAMQRSMRERGAEVAV